MKPLTACLGAIMTMTLTAAAAPSAVDARVLSIAGYWTLNSDLSDTAVATRGDTDAQQEKHWARQIFGAGLASPAAPPTATSHALLRALLEPSGQLTVAPADGHRLTIVDAAGVWRTFSTSGHAERIDYGVGVAETATRWEQRWLRQDIAVGHGVTLVKRYLPAPENDHLIVTVSLEGASASGRPLMHLYESDRVR